MSEQQQASAADAVAEDDSSAAAQQLADGQDWPLFYRQPELLNAGAHGQWRIRPAGLGFASEANSIPVVTGEFAAAARCYPIVFAGAQHTPVVVLGLQQRNQFVEDECWQEGAYVPAYVRRYPFVFAEVGEGFALAIDAQAPNVLKEGSEGQPLFEAGKPAPITQQALQFCEAFTRDHAITQQFVKLLVEQQLLVERTANITLPAGSRSSLGGFSVVDAQALAALPDEVVVDWHRKGWLALVHAHLLSLARFGDLLTR